MSKTMLSALYHRQTFFNASSPLILTALLTTSDVEEAFRLTNHGVRADTWWENPGVLHVYGGSQRSTSVLDVLVVGDQVYQYEDVGTGRVALPCRVVTGQAVWSRGAAVFELGLLNETTVQHARHALSPCAFRLPALLGCKTADGVNLTLSDPQVSTADLLSRAASLPIPAAGEAMSVAAFKRELRPGRLMALLQRQRNDQGHPAHERLDPPLLREVLQVGSDQAMFSVQENDAGRSYMAFPTRKNGSRLEAFDGGFILRYPDGLRLTYGWLSD